jgi:hypothetical protein
LYWYKTLKEAVCHQVSPLQIRLWEHPKQLTFWKRLLGVWQAHLSFLSILAAVFLPRHIVVDQSELNGQIKTEAPAPGFDIQNNQEATPEAPAQQDGDAPEQAPAQ